MYPDTVSGIVYVDTYTGRVPVHPVPFLHLNHSSCKYLLCFRLLPSRLLLFKHFLHRSTFFLLPTCYLPFRLILLVVLPVLLLPSERDFAFISPLPVPDYCCDHPIVCHLSPQMANCRLNVAGISFSAPASGRHQEQGSRCVPPYPVRGYIAKYGTGGTGSLDGRRFKRAFSFDTARSYRAVHISC